MILAAGAAGVDEFPNMKACRVANIYSEENYEYAWRFWGRTMDLVLNGGDNQYRDSGGVQFFNRLKQAAQTNGRTIKVCLYTNYHNDLVCHDTLGSSGDCQYNREHICFMAAADAYHSGDQSCRDSMYITVGDDSIMQSLGAGGSLCSGTGGARVINGHSADLKKQRFSFRTWLNDPGEYSYPAGTSWIINYWYSPIAVIRASGLINWADNYTCADSAVDGWYWDNAYPRDGAGMSNYLVLNGSWGGATGGSGYSTAQADVDWDQLAAPYTTAGKNTAATKFCQFGTAVAESLLNHGYETWANYSGIYPVDWLDNMCLQGGNPTNNGDSVVANVYFECGGGGDALRGFLTNTWTGGITRLLAYADTCRNHPTMGNAWEFRYWESPVSDNVPAYMAHSSYIAFLVIQDTGSSYYSISRRFQDDGSVQNFDTLPWSYSLFRYDLGYVISPTYSIQTTGTASDGGPIHLLSREYEDGWALFLPMEAGYTTTTNYYSKNMGEAVYVLGEDFPGQSNDSNYKEDGIVRVYRGRGTYVVKVRGESGPTIRYITPPDGYEGYLDSTYTVTAQISDDYGLDSCYNYLRHPVFDSLLINKEVYGVDITEATPSVDITWPFLGTSHVVYVVWDDSDHVARDSSDIYITQPVTSQDTLVTRIKGVTIQNQGIEP